MEILKGQEAIITTESNEHGFNKLDIVRFVEKDGSYFVFTNGTKTQSLLESEFTLMIDPSPTINIEPIESLLHEMNFGNRESKVKTIIEKASEKYNTNEGLMDLAIASDAKLNIFISEIIRSLLTNNDAKKIAGNHPR